MCSAQVQLLIGEELALRTGSYGLESKISELPLYVGLGVLAGGVALLFDSTTNACRQMFAKVPLIGASDDGASGGIDVRPVLGGLLCGLIGLAVPQILFVGYDTLNAILAAGDSPIAAESLDVVQALLDGVLKDGFLGEAGASLGALTLLGLLGAKLFATAICAGSGLIGGTFAPSLFLGATLGAFYQSVTSDLLYELSDAIATYQASIGVPVGTWGVIPSLTVDEAPAYALIGAAAVLASVFRAPMTATLLVFELCRDYDLVLPLLAAAGTGPRVVEWAKSQTLATPKAAAPKAAAPKVGGASAHVAGSPIEVIRQTATGAATRVKVPDDCQVDFLTETCLEEDDRTDLSEGASQQ